MLDLACGPGGWACEVARLYPQIDVIGVDISEKMMRYARAHAQAQRLDNVELPGNERSQSPLSFRIPPSILSMHACSPVSYPRPYGHHLYRNAFALHDQEVSSD